MTAEEQLQQLRIKILQNIGVEADSLRALNTCQLFDKFVDLRRKWFEDKWKAMGGQLYAVGSELPRCPILYEGIHFD